MIEIPYTVSKLAGCVGYKDVYNNRDLSKIENKKEEAKNALRLIENGKIFLNPLRPTIIRQKPAFTFNNLSSELVSRLIGKNIRVNYNIRQSDRQAIISNLASLLYEGTPFNIYRLDIKNFYENINRKLLIHQLLEEGKCSWQTLELLFSLFNSFDSHNIVGLPRGLSISSILSEVYLTDFDIKIRKKSGVFFYARFVDDILLVVSEDVTRADLDGQLKNILPVGLEFHNEGKRSFLSLPKLQNKQDKFYFNSFDYLGYEFKVFNIFDNECGYRKKRKVLIDISSVKVEKIKLRLIHSFTNYLSNGRSEESFNLLKNRIRALTGNFTIRDPMTGLKIKTGIYFNYSHKNNFEYCALLELDKFYRKLLFSTKYPLSCRIARKLSTSQRRSLAGYSFMSGFASARHHSFNYGTLKSIKECWRK
ncbi:antiviral reverse transcriptase Drt3a [Phytohalomonas tamaricis]|uniref:antiviral reverse transcriptase Drt3a n=1 Tax=Phytohalomonas tamaricis TaxID=2081032 RepID=UPI000D0B8CB8|nr:antiviral reverse transcriptase Drt3a [Phytohalomonas tamaricis]